MRNILLAILLFLEPAWAETVASAVGPSSPNSLDYEKSVVKECLAKVKPPRTYQHMDVLIDNGECKKGANNAAEGKDAPKYERIDPSRLPVTTGTNRDLENLRKAIKSQLDVCLSSKDLNSKFTMNVDDKEIQLPKSRYCVDTQRTLLKLANGSDSYKEFMQKAKNALDWYTPAACKEEPSLATAYYTPVYNVYHDPSQSPQPQNTVPILSKPSDHVYAKVQPCVKGGDDGHKSCQCLNGTCSKEVRCPYPDRQTVVNSLSESKDSKSLTLGFMDAANNTDGQLEGSWVGVFPDGTRVAFQTDGSTNGHPNYFMSSIRECINEQIKAGAPGKWDNLKNNEMELYNLNPNYAFANVTKGEPKGKTGAELYGNSDVAVDPQVTPLGSAVLYNVYPRVEDKKYDKPVQGDRSSKPRESRMSVAADIGSAIKKPCRIDVYKGTGQAAYADASNMRANSWLFMGVVKEKSAQ